MAFVLPRESYRISRFPIVVHVFQVYLFHRLFRHFDISRLPLYSNPYRIDRSLGIDRGIELLQTVFRFRPFEHFVQHLFQIPRNESFLRNFRPVVGPMLKPFQPFERLSSTQHCLHSQHLTNIYSTFALNECCSNVESIFTTLKLFWYTRFQL